MNGYAVLEYRFLAMLVGALLLTVGCSGGDSAADAEPYVKVVNVEVETLAPVSFAATVRITGEAQPATDVTVSAEESGRLESFVAAKGSRISAGQPIARINDDILAAQTDEARAAAEIAADRYERLERLWEEEQIGSEIAYLQARADAESAGARHTQLQARLDRTTIRSPVAGTFDADLVDAGEMVQPGMAVARVVDASSLKVVGGVPERFATSVTTGGEAEVTFNILPGKTFPGRIDFVGTAVDRQSRTFPIEIVMDNPDGELKPYMIANVVVVMRRIEDAIVVPREALLRTEDGFQALVVESEGGHDVASARPVTLDASGENTVVISNGLDAGDRLIVRGQQLADPGDRVRIVGGAD